MKNNKPKVIVIVGPTASGKTATSIEIAKKLNGEIVSADSMQIYKEMNIGTAKPSLAERDGITHYMLDIASPDEEYNVSKYKKDAERCIDEILTKGKLPIVVGGTGLYINALVDSIEFSEVKEDLEYRIECEEKVEKYGAEFLHNELRKIDEEAADKIDANNVRRVIRALEIYKVTGKTKTELDKESVKEAKYDYKIYGIEWDRETLYNRIEKRVDIMFEEGLLDEVKELKEKYNFSKTAIQGLGYKEVIEYLENKITYDEMVDKLKMETRRYAKRQLTWFRRDKRISWHSIEKIVEEILKENM